jgi:hypothetical protein
VSLLGLALGAVVKARARELGFDRVAIGPADPPEHGEALEAWLDAGYAGTMGYLGRGRAERLDPARLLRGARSVVAVAMSYNPANGAERNEDWRGVSRYARGRDYHDVIRPRLVELGEFIGSAAGAPVASRAAVDSSAVLERDLAARAGPRLDRQEHEPPDPVARLVLLHRHRTHDRRASVRPAGARSLRNLHGLPRRLSDAGVRRPRTCSTRGAASRT